MDRTSFDAGAHVECAVFLGTLPVLALADGRIVTPDGAEEPALLSRHGEAILAAVPTRDGAALLTSGEDGAVMRHDAAGEAETLARRKGKWIDALAAGNDGAVAFVAGRETLILLKGREKAIATSRAPAGLAFAPKGQRLALALVDVVELHWVGTDAPPQRLDWKGAHLGVTFSPDGRYVISTMQEMALHGWRLADGHHMRMTGYPAKVRSMAFTAKGKWLATSGADAAILWPFLTKDGPSGKAPKQLGVLPALVTRVAPHPSEEAVALGYQDGRVILVRIEDEAEVPLAPDGGGAVSALAWDKTGQSLLVGRESGRCDLIRIGRG